MGDKSHDKELNDLLYEVKDILAYYLDYLLSDSYGESEDWIYHVSEVKDKLEKVNIENNVISIKEDKK